MSIEYTGREFLETLRQLDNVKYYLLISQPGTCEYIRTVMQSDESRQI